MVPAHTRYGKSFACIGGCLAIFSFFVLPWVSLGLLGSYTAIQMTLMAADGNRGSLWSLFFWLELCGVVVIAILALIACFRRDGERSISLVLIWLAALGLLGVIGMYVNLSQDRALFIPDIQFLGAGFWYYSAGLVLTLIGAIVQRASASSQGNGPGNRHLFEQDIPLHSSHSTGSTDQKEQ